MGTDGTTKERAGRGRSSALRARIGDSAFLRVAVALLLSLTGGGLLLAMGGYDPAAAGRALLQGAFGSPAVFLSVTLVRSVPLILTGLAVALAFRGGIWNIGAEGQFYAGAVAGVTVGLHGGGLPGPALVVLLLVAAFLGGAAWAVLPTLLRLRLGVGEVIPTILLNFVAIQGAAYLVHGPLQEARGVFPQTDAIVEGARLPILVEGSRLHVGLLLAMAAAVLVWLLLRSTVFGFHLRTLGEGEEVARVAGKMDIARVVAWTLLLSGAVAGVAGGVEVSGVTFALYEGLSPGYGYTAIAVALLGGLHPLGVVLAGLFFGALQGGAGAMQRDAVVPWAWVQGMEALVILAVLVVERLSRGRWGVGS